MAEVTQFNIGTKGCETVVFDGEAVHHDGDSMRYSEMQSVSWSVADSHGRLFSVRKGWLRFGADSDYFEIRDSIRYFTQKAGMMEGFLSMLAFVQELIVPMLARRAIAEVFTGSGRFRVGAITITRDGVYVNGMLGEKMCRWDWRPVAEAVSGEAHLMGFFSGQTIHRTQIVFYFYSPTNAKKIELARLSSGDDNAYVALAVVNAITKSFLRT